MTFIKETKYPLLVLFLILTLNLNSQDEFIPFLYQAELPACFENIEPIHVDELIEYGKTSFKSFEISSNYDEQREVLELISKENCHDTKKLQLKHISNDKGEFIFMFRELNDGQSNYGNIKLYQLQDSLWSQGKEIKISWTQLFDVSKDNLEKLREQDQYPKCMISFQKEGMRIEVPWRLYTFGENSESNGYIKAGGKQPILLRYTTFL